MNVDPYVYWFSDIECLCTRNTVDGSFYVLNGAWDFKVVNGYCVINEVYLTDGDYNLCKVGKPKAMTRKQFDKLHPNFGY